MSRLQSALEAAGGLDITRAVFIGGDKYLLFTRYSEADAQWQIGTSDGLEIWLVELNEDDLKEYSGDQDEKTFLADLCHSLRDSDGDVQLLKSHSHLTLCVKSTSTDLEFSLYECSAAKKKVEMKVLLFSLWDRLQATRTKLKKSEEELTEARKRTDSDHQALTEITSRSSSSKAAASRPKKIAGASLVNPSAKRRKKAHGVVYGE